ncbi:MAG: LD-carboxypeptidase [Candidatus Kapaibacterium sp.]
MKRRDFMAGAALFAAISSSGNINAGAMARKGRIKPAGLIEGSKIGIIAPGSAVSDPMDIYRAKEACEKLGLIPEFGRTFSIRQGYKTKPARIRADEINEFFDDGDIKALFAIRGGYGCSEVLPLLDYDLIARNPKVFLGYSDITALLNAINQNTGIVVFHGPVLLSSFNDFTLNYFKKVLFNTEAPLELANPSVQTGLREAYPVLELNPGKAKGILTGGNLSIISSLMGTPFEIDAGDKLLMLEEVGEAPYRIDRMLTQLKLAGKLQASKGVIFGRCDDCGKGKSASTWDPELTEVLQRVFRDLDIPLMYGLLTGHTANQITLPFGIEAEMNTGKGTLVLSESAII